MCTACLIKWHWLPLKNFTVKHLVTTSQAFTVSSEVHQWNLSRASWIEATHLQNRLITANFNVSPPSTPTSPKWTLLLRFLDSLVCTCSIYFVPTILPSLIQCVFRRVCKIAKSDYLPSSRPPVRPHSTTRLSLNGLSLNSIFENFSKICTEQSTFI